MSTARAPSGSETSASVASSSEGRRSHGADDPGRSSRRLLPAIRVGVREREAGVGSSSRALRPRNSVVNSAERLRPEAGDGVAASIVCPKGNEADRLRRRLPRTRRRAHGRNRSHRARKPRRRRSATPTRSTRSRLWRGSRRSDSSMSSPCSGRRGGAAHRRRRSGVLGGRPRLPDQRRPVRGGPRDHHPVRRLLAVRCAPSADAGRDLRRSRTDDRNRSERRHPGACSARRSRADSS